MKQPAILCCSSVRNIRKQNLMKIKVFIKRDTKRCVIYERFCYHVYLQVIWVSNSKTEENLEGLIQIQNYKICVYVCIHKCIYIHVYVYIDRYIDGSINRYLYIHIYYTHTHTHTRIRTHLRILTLLCQPCASTTGSCRPSLGLLSIPLRSSVKYTGNLSFFRSRILTFYCNPYRANRVSSKVTRLFLIE